MEVRSNSNIGIKKKDPEGLCSNTKQGSKTGNVMHRQNQAPIFYLTLLCLKQEDQLVRTTIFRKH